MTSQVNSALGTGTAPNGRMTSFERLRLLQEYIRPPLNRVVRQRLLAVVEALGPQPRVLDIGARESPYTIGVPVAVTMTDLPRETEAQEILSLGWTPDVVSRLRERRSNIEALVYDDMTESRLPSDSYDCALAVEVIEHVDLDESFVREVARVLRPGGRFILTTPNGEYVPNKNPDHRRHYSRSGLEALLKTAFPHVTVEYAIPGHVFRRLGLISWRRWPLLAPFSAAANVWNHFIAARDVSNQPSGTHHLIGICIKNPEYEADGCSSGRT